MAIGRTTRWALAAVAAAAAAVAAATPATASRDASCVVKTQKCCWDPFVCGVATKRYVKLVRYQCFKKFVQKVRVPCGHDGRPTNRLAEEEGEEKPAADAADDATAGAVSDAATPADAPAAEGDVSPAVPDVVSRRAYTYRDGRHGRQCIKKRLVAYPAKCVKKVVRVKYFPRICYKKKCTVVHHGHGRGKASYVDYKRGVDGERVGGGGAKGYFHRTLGY